MLPAMIKYEQSPSHCFPLWCFHHNPLGQISPASIVIVWLLNACIQTQDVFNRSNAGHERVGEIICHDDHSILEFQHMMMTLWFRLDHPDHMSGFDGVNTNIITHHIWPLHYVCLMFIHSMQHFNLKKHSILSLIRVIHLHYQCNFQLFCTSSL